MLTLIKQTEEGGMVTNFWVAPNREELYSKLHLGYPDPALKSELIKKDHEIFTKKLTEFKVGDARFTLMVDHVI